MSFALDGPMVGSVYIPTNESRTAVTINIIDVIEQVDVPEIVEALDILIQEAQNGEDGNEKLRRQGKYLLKITEVERWYQPDTIDGLFFAQGQDMLPGGSFSVVRMAVWMRAKPAGIEPARQQLRNNLIESAFSDIFAANYDPEFGVPVQPTTRVVPMHPTDAQRPEGFQYQFLQDALAIEGLAIPDTIKRIFAGVVDMWHEAEQADVPDEYKARLLANLKEAQRLI